MTLKNRTELEAHFKNLRRPSQREFADLIGSVLNMRDDQFLGRWRPGTTYRTGDVVIYRRSLWEVMDDGAGNDQEICSHTPPDEDEENWQSLIVPVEDDDWFLDDLTEELPPPVEGETVDELTIPAAMYANLRVVRVGVGTDSPTGVLDVHDKDRGRLLFDVEDQDDPVLCLINLHPETAQHYLAAGVGAAKAFLITDAPEGLAIHAGDPIDQFCHEAHVDQGPLLVAVKLDGKVGIGTDSPYTRLEITNTDSGRFLFNLDRKVNPALGIINKRPGTRENYLAVGADNDVAVFVTDSDYGFIFRAGGEAGTDDHEIDINQGEVLLTITPEDGGKLGIGRQPGDYQLDLDGLARGYGYYVDTDEGNLKNVQPLGTVMAKISQLRPVRFTWQNATGLGGQGRQIGLIAHEVEDYFPEVVKTNRDRTKAVAFHALVPVLVRGLQEQQTTIESLQSRLDDVESRLAALEGAT